MTDQDGASALSWFMFVVSISGRILVYFDTILSMEMEPILTQTREEMGTWFKAFPVQPPGYLVFVGLTYSTLRIHDYMERYIIHEAS
jgi:hypothetical protein